MRILKLSILAGLGLAGCISFPTPAPTFVPAKLGKSYSTHTKAEDIELYRSKLPDRKYSEIGSVTYCCSLNMETTISYLRTKAAESGGDALMGLEYDAGGTAVATVIRYE